MKSRVVFILRILPFAFLFFNLFLFIVRICNRNITFPREIFGSVNYIGLQLNFHKQKFLDFAEPINVQNCCCSNEACIEYTLDVQKIISPIQIR